MLEEFKRDYYNGVRYHFDGSDPNDLVKNQKEIAMLDDENVSEHSTFSSAKIEELISIGGFKPMVVDSLPEIGESNILYLVPASETGETNIYEEYIWVDDKYEMVGTTAVDLSDYYTKEQTNELLVEKQNVIDDLDTIRSGATLGATALQEVPSEYVTDSELTTALTKYATTSALTAVEEIIEQDSYVISSHINEIEDTLPLKQDVITDLETIRSGATLGMSSVQVEVDPTVPAWAKESTKPTYSVSEISGLTEELAGKQPTGNYADGSVYTVSGTKAKINSNYSLDVGFNNGVGDKSIAVGQNLNSSSGTKSISVGTNHNIYGVGNAAFGEGITLGNGVSNDCFGAGYYNEVFGNYGVAFGVKNISYSKNQFVLGEFNKTDTSGGKTTRGEYAFIIGNGTAENDRSNAFAVDWNGNLVLFNSGSTVTLTPAKLSSLVNSNFVQSDTISTIWKGTQVQYDAIASPSDTTFYIIIEPLELAISGDTIQYGPNMSWEQWIGSSYNTFGWTIGSGDDYIYNGSDVLQSSGVSVVKTDIIDGTKTYSWSASVVLINFTIEGTPYQAESGMTWGDWVADPAYNTGGYTLSSVNGKVVVPNEYGVYVGIDTATIVYSNELINDNGSYYNIND